jgi:hypothetical protein
MGQAIYIDIQIVVPIQLSVATRQPIGINSIMTGRPGLSNYELAVATGEFTGTLEEYLASLHGQDGYTPRKGVDYFDGQDGYTPQKGVDYFDGQDGKSAFQAAQENGYPGTEAQFNADLGNLEFFKQLVYAGL